jgi:hypothetical protein
VPPSERVAYRLTTDEDADTENGKGECLAQIGYSGDYWNPKIPAELNDSCIKLVKMKRQFVRHHHEKDDELFFVT